MIPLVPVFWTFVVMALLSSFIEHQGVCTFKEFIKTAVINFFLLIGMVVFIFSAIYYFNH